MRIVAVKILMPANVIKIKKRHRRQNFSGRTSLVPTVLRGNPCHLRVHHNMHSHAGAWERGKSKTNPYDM